MKKIFKRSLISLAVLSVLFTAAPVAEASTWWQDIPPTGGGGHMCPGVPSHLTGTWGFCP